MDAVLKRRRSEQNRIYDTHSLGLLQFGVGCLTSLEVQVTVPQHRMTPLKAQWMALYEPVTQNMKLDMRMNLKSKKVQHPYPTPLLPTGPARSQTAR